LRAQWLPVRVKKHQNRSGAGSDSIRTHKILGSALFRSRRPKLLRRRTTLANFRTTDRAERDAQDLSLGGEPMRIRVTVLAAAIDPDLIRALAD
jgi:hypothetical protein